MSTPHRPAYSRLAGGVATDAETISSINSEITMTTSEVRMMSLPFDVILCVGAIIDYHYYINHGGIT